MGTNTSKELKTSFEKGLFEDHGPVREINLEQVRSIRISGPGQPRLACLIRELNTADYTQTLSKVDEFLKKMNKASPFIASFFFITESPANPNLYSLVFEAGPRNLQYSRLAAVFCPVFRAVLGALEFLESIQLFHPRVGLESVVQVEGARPVFKLINQFCYSNFLSFITNVYLSDSHSPGALQKILQQKKEANLDELRAMLARCISQNPVIRQPSHPLSNIMFFEFYLQQLDPRRASFADVARKFEEFFDVPRNANRQLSSQGGAPAYLPAPAKGTKTNPSAPAQRPPFNSVQQPGLEDLLAQEARLVAPGHQRAPDAPGHLPHFREESLRRAPHPLVQQRLPALAAQGAHLFDALRAAEEPGHFEVAPVLEGQEFEHFEGEDSGQHFPGQPRGPGEVEVPGPVGQHESLEQNKGQLDQDQK